MLTQLLRLMHSVVLVAIVVLYKTSSLTKYQLYPNLAILIFVNFAVMCFTRHYFVTDDSRFSLPITRHALCRARQQIANENADLLISDTSTRIDATLHLEPR